MTGSLRRYLRSITASPELQRRWSYSVSEGQTWLAGVKCRKIFWITSCCWSFLASRGVAFHKIRLSGRVCTCPQITDWELSPYVKVIQGGGKECFITKPSEAIFTPPRTQFSSQDSKVQEKKSIIFRLYHTFKFNSALFTLVLYYMLFLILKWRVRT